MEAAPLLLHLRLTRHSSGLRRSTISLLAPPSTAYPGYLPMTQFGLVPSIVPFSSLRSSFVFSLVTRNHLHCLYLCHSIPCSLSLSLFRSLYLSIYPPLPRSLFLALSFLNSFSWVEAIHGLPSDLLFYLPVSISLLFSFRLLILSSLVLIICIFCVSFCPLSFRDDRSFWFFLIDFTPSSN